MYDVVQTFYNRWQKDPNQLLYWKLFLTRLDKQKYDFTEDMEFIINWIFIGYVSWYDAITLIYSVSTKLT